jgi:hypothetical protein
MKPTLACLLILALVIPASARDRTPLEQAQKITPGSRVKVTLKSRETIMAILLDVKQDTVTVRAWRQGDWPDRELPFQAIQKITPSKDHSSAKEALLLPVAVVALPLWLVYCGIFNRGCGGPWP